MRNAVIAEELAKIRAELARLRERETTLENSLASSDGAAPAPRPGWPIRRIVVTEGISLH
jgi:hypothetical protein